MMRGPPGTGARSQQTQALSPPVNFEGKFRAKSSKIFLNIDILPQISHISSAFAAYHIEQIAPGRILRPPRAAYFVLP